MWVKINEEFVVAVYNWRSGVEQGLSLVVGDVLRVLERSGDWYRGHSLKKPASRGVFPVIYVQPRTDIGAVANRQNGDRSVADSIACEIACVLHEWSEHCKQLYILGQREQFEALWKLMAELLDCRRQLLTGALTHEQLHELRSRVSAKIDWGNRELGLDLVPRQNGVAVNLSNVLLASLYDVHCQSLEMCNNISTTGTLRRRPAENTNRQSLQVTLRDFGYNISDHVQLFFSLYDSVRCKYISERFLVNINGGSSEGGESNRWTGGGSTIFTELYNLRQYSGLYLVISAVRIGRMHVSVDSPRPSSSAPPQPRQQPLPRRFRRPLGCAVLDLADTLQHVWSEEGSTAGFEHELSVKLYQCDERDFYQLHQLLIRQANKCSVVGGEANCGILLSLRPLSGSAEQFQQERGLSYLKQASISHKLGFPEIVMPGDFRNDLYLSLERGEFERGGKSTAKNIEVGVVVVDSDGRHLSDGVVCGSGEAGSSMYRSVIIYHNNAPRWSDTVKLNVSLELFASVHVRLEFYHCSSHDSRLSKEKGERKLFAFSFARLMNADGSALKDGQHELCVYRCDDAHKLKKPGSYLHLPWHSEMLSAGNSPGGDFSRASKEIVVINTLLCSTKLTQNIDLLSLLKWRQSSDNIKTTLTRVMNLGGEEIVKFLQDVLDSLFGMFSSDCGNSTPHSGIVFKVLVSIFVRLKESRFENFRPILDTYVEQHFSAALIYKGLISCVRYYVDQAPVSDTMEPLVHGLHALEFVFKFVVRSRVLFKQQSGACDDTDFCSEMVQLFTAFGQLLANNNNTVVHGAQVALLQSIVPVFELVRPLMPESELVRHLAALIDALPTDSLPVQLTKQKLATLRQVVASDLFKHGECRIVLLRFVCDQLCCHLCPHQQLLDTAQLLDDVLTHLFSIRSETEFDAHVSVLCAGVLDSLVRLILATESTQTSSTTLPRSRGGAVDAGGKGDSLRGRLVCLLCSLLSLMSSEHYRRLWARQTDVSQTARFLHRVIILFKEVLAEKLFPNDWFVLRMEIYRVLLAMLKEFSAHISVTFVDKRQLNVQLILNFMTLASRLATLPDLQLECLSELKRQAVIDNYGDMRVEIASLLVNMWTQIGDQKMAFVPALVGPLLEVSLVHQSSVRTTLLPVFYQMMCVEHASKGCFKQVEVEMVDKLDILISENKGDVDYLRFFDKIMTSAVKEGKAELVTDGSRFVSSVVGLLERLFDYRSVLEGSDNRDKRMSCTVRLLEFYRSEIDRAEMYQRYIYKLHALHVEAGSWVEAALTLLLHAEQLQWRSRVLHADHLYPVQSEWQRKEQLLRLALQLLDRAQCWELGLPLLEQLAEQYRSRLFAYHQLADTLRSQARFFEQIVGQPRGQHEYFRVGFYGRAYPAFVRNKVFIYRGLECERLASFIERIQVEFPSAKLLSKLGAPGEDTRNSDGQFVQVCNVRPLPSYAPSSEHVEVPDRVLAFYRTNQVHKFQYDRPLPATCAENNTQFGHVWLERCTMRVSGELPGILRWCPVVASETCRVSPVQHGCETVAEATDQLRALTAECGNSDSTTALAQLTMRLQGTIDAAVNGGLANLTTFFSPEYGGQFPDQLPQIQQLRTLINDQMSVLERALEVHGRLAAASLQPLHERLCQCFSQLRRSVTDPADPAQLVRASSFGAGSRASHSSLRLSGHHERKASIISTPLPPVPVECGRASVPASLFPSEYDSMYSIASESRDTGRLSTPLSVPLRAGGLCERPVSTTASISSSSLSSGHDSALSSTSFTSGKQHHRGEEQNGREGDGQQRKQHPRGREQDGGESEGQQYHIVKELERREAEEQQSDEPHDYICIPHDSEDLLPPLRPPKQQTSPATVAPSAAVMKHASTPSPLAPPLPPKPADKRCSSVSLDLSQHTPQKSTPTHKKQWSVSSLSEIVGSPPPLPPKYPTLPPPGVSEENQISGEPIPETGSILANYSVLDCSNPRVFPPKPQQ